LVPREGEVKKEAAHERGKTIGRPGGYMEGVKRNIAEVSKAVYETEARTCFKFINCV
jgi:hypothetical protein